MELVNIHFAGSAGFQPAPEPETSYKAPAPEKETRLKLRKVSVSPLEEYALRPGEVRPISDALASLILSRKGRAELTAKGITVTRNDIGGKRTYHHPDSPLCNDLSQKERKFFYVLNSLRPDIIHILDENGRYLESLPEKFEPGVLNNAEQAKEYADQKRQFNRVASRMQELHKDDTAQAIEDLRNNNNIAHRIVQTMPSGQAPSTEPIPSALGERIIKGERTITGERNRRSSSTNLNRATEDWTAPARNDRSPDITSEDWTPPARNHEPATKTIATEKW